MAKGNNNIRNKKPHSSKPYDVSNSFVKKVTSGVTSLLPQTSWLSRWFASTSSAAEDNPSTSNDGEDREEERVGHSPPTKRARIPLNRPFPANSFRVSSPIDRGETHPWPSESITSPIPNVFPDSAVPGPSGLSRTPVASDPFHTVSAANEGLEGKINGDGGSDSSESTSGCSSLAPQRATSSGTGIGLRSSLDNKMSNHMSSYSLFPSATHKLSSSINPSLSRRRPSFNVSSFGSPNLDSSKLSRESSLNSPFYIGRTMYGGASAYRRPREGASSESFLSTRRSGVTVRPANEKSQIGASAEASMSQTARRILEALEQFSSPVSEARRMPLQSQPVLSAKRKRTLESPAKSSAVPAAITNPLTIPMAPERLRLHRLQDATEAARRIASSVATTSNKYTLRASDEGIQRAGAGKVTKSKPLDEDEQPLPVNLPHVSLPITTLPSFELFSLPGQSASASSRTDSSTLKFKFTDKGGDSGDKVEVEKSKIPCAVSSTTSSSSSFSIVGSPAAASGSGTGSYHISNSPMNPKGKVEKSNSTHSSDLSNASAVSSFAAKGATFSTVRADSAKSPMTNDYVFSTPTVLPPSKSKETTESKTKNFDFCKPEVLECAKYSKAKRNEPNGFHKLPSNSNVNDVQESIVLSASRKEVSDKVNAANDLEYEKKGVGASPGKQNSGWGAKFKQPDTWECPACMVRNKNDVKVCVCCGGNQPLTSDSKKSEKNCIIKEKDSSGVSSGWGSNFGLQPGMWECSACLVRNRSSDNKCIACTTPRPAAEKPSAVATTKAVTGGWGSQFKSPSDKWECSACLVRNEEKDEKCIACTTPRKAETSSKKNDNLGNAPVKSTGDWGQKFKKPSDNWECPVCMISNKNSAMKCAACEEPKPGVVTNRSSTGGSIKFNFEMPTGASTFKFGIDKAEVTQSVTKSSTFTFGGGTKTDTSSAPASTGFVFGASSAETKIPSGIKFGISSAESSSPAGKPIAGESNVTSTNMQNAAVPSSGNLTSQKPETRNVSGFSFGMPASNPTSSTGDNVGHSKKLANPSDSNDSSKKDFKFTVTQASPVVSSSDDVERKGTAFVAPLQKQEQTNTKETKPGFNFGLSPSASVTSSTTTVTTTATVAVAPKALGYNYGSNLPTSSTTTSVATSVTAGSVAPVSSSPSNLFSFGSTSPSFKPFGTSVAQTTTSGFFGASLTGQVKSAADSLFANKSAAPATVPVFGNSSAASPKTVPSGASFVSTTAAPDAAVTSVPTTTSVSTFGTPTSIFASPASTTSTNVAFGSGMTKPSFASATSGFGSVATVAAASTTVTTTNTGSNPSSFAMPTTTASFGAPATSSNLISTNVPTFGSSAAPAFGTASTTVPVATTASTPSFGAPAPVAFGTAATSGNVFGTANASQSFNTTSSNVFGSSNTPSFGSTATTPAFGSSATPAPGFGNTFGTTPAAAPAFGASTPAVTTSSTTSLPSFGTFSNASKPGLGLFLFGSNPTSTTTAQNSNFSFNVASQASGGSGAAAFSFGSAAAPNATVTTSTNTVPSATAAVAPSATFGGFSFSGSATAAAPTASSLFSNAAPAAAPVFGAPTAMPPSAPTASAFGTTSATNNNVFRPPAFNFSSGASQQPFSFGGASQAGAAQSAGASGFSFGQGQTPAQPQAPALHFNPNQQPTFNFTRGETPQFTASSPTPTATPQRRVVKKAVRRSALR